MEALDPAYLKEIEKLLAMSEKGDEEEEEDDNPNADAWVTSSMERLHNRLEAQKFMPTVSEPKNIAELIMRMRVEQNLWGDSVNTVKEQYRSSVWQEYKKRKSAWAQAKKKQQQQVPEIQETKKQENTAANPSINVGDCFTHKVSSGVEKYTSFHTKGAGPRRITTRKFSRLDFCRESYDAWRSTHQVESYASDSKKQPLVDKTKSCLIEVTVYGKVDPDKATGSWLFPKSAPAYAVEILANQTLAELRDALYCENDFIYLKEMDHPEEKQMPENLARNKLRSSMMLIDNTIYDDTRWPNTYKYSKQIFRWLRQNPDKKIGPFKIGNMRSTLLRELTIQFGFPYLFRHLGDCEHVFVFNRIRLMHFEDEYRLSYYPRIPWARHAGPKYCMLDCGWNKRRLARWILFMDYEPIPRRTMLTCNKCVKQLCYNAFGSKLLTFRLYPFRQLVCELPGIREHIKLRIKL